MTQVLLISVPKTAEHLFETIHRKITVELQLCSCYRFQLPSLRVGKLDTLVSLSDSLQKVDTNVEATCWRLLRQHEEWKGTDAQVPMVQGQNYLDYIIGFRWSEEKFSSTQPLADIVQSIVEHVNTFEEELKKLAAEYSHRKQLTTTEERKTRGSLMVRSLDTIVEPQNTIETEHMTTVFLVFPKCSAQRLAEDGEFVLYSMVIFRSCFEQLKKNVREKRYTIREYKPTTSTETMTFEEQQGSLETLRQHCREWVATAFSETAIAWTHIKAVRLFVESVLRFGLPVSNKNIISMAYLCKRNDNCYNYWSNPKNGR
eukprot:jgi/Galph1/586/GphlegSOOS_G5353.1